MSPADFILSETAGKKLTNHAKNSIARSIILAREAGENKIENIHLLYSIFSETGSMGFLIMRDMGFEKRIFVHIVGKLKHALEPNQQKGFPVAFSEAAKKTLIHSFRLAKDLNSGYVGTEHMVYALIESEDTVIKNIMDRMKNEKSPARRKLNRTIKSDVNMAAFSDQFFNFSDFGSLSDLPFSEDIKLPQKFETPNPKTAIPYLEKFAVDINKAVYGNEEIVIGREREIERMIYILGRKNKNNPLLIGHPGVGKTALVYGLAQMINSQNVPAFLFGKKIMNLDVASLVAGTSFRGEFEMRLKEVIREASVNKNIILFIDEIHNISGAGNISGSLDLANIIKPALSQGDIRLIGATTFPEFKKHIEKDAALERRFQTIQIKEPGIEEAKKILLGIKDRYEAFHNVTISPDIVDLAVELSSRYIKSRFLPDKAIDVVDETAAYIRSKTQPSEWALQLGKLENQRKRLAQEKEKLIKNENYEKAIDIRTLEKEMEKKIASFKKSHEHSISPEKIPITPADIYKTIARMSGIPEEKLGKSKNEKIKNIGRTLSEYIIGQREAIEKISGAILRSQSGLEIENRPLGSFLFMGPTGVGKTLTAKVLAKEFFSDPEAFIRIDMSEFMERHTISALIGSPAGYVGYGEGGRLTEQVKRNPYSVVLFDEIEKAHPEVSNILLQILDDGILTDAEGVSVNFRNTIIILTSNIGTDDFSEVCRIGFEEKKRTVSKKQSDRFEKVKENAIREMETIIRPELLNRLDNIIVFNPLCHKDIHHIVNIEIEILKKRLARQNIQLEITKPVLDFLTKKSISDNVGARPVRRNIQEMLENKIAQKIVFDKIKNGKITADIRKGKVILK